MILCYRKRDTFSYLSSDDRQGLDGDSGDGKVQEEFWEAFISTIPWSLLSADVRSQVDVKKDLARRQGHPWLQVSQLTCYVALSAEEKKMLIPSVGVTDVYTAGTRSGFGGFVLIGQKSTCTISVNCGTAKSGWACWVEKRMKPLEHHLLRFQCFLVLVCVLTKRSVSFGASSLHSFILNWWWGYVYMWITGCAFKIFLWIIMHWNKIK